MFVERMGVLLRQSIPPADLAAYVAEVKYATAQAKAPTRAAYALLEASTPQLVEEALRARRKRMLAREVPMAGRQPAVNWSEITHMLTVALGRPGPLPYDEWIASGCSRDVQELRAAQQQEWDEKHAAIVTNHLDCLRNLINVERSAGRHHKERVDAYMEALRAEMAKWVQQ